MTIWWLAIDSNNGYCSYAELKERAVVAQGWPQFGNLEEQIGFHNGLDENTFKRKIQDIGDDVYNGDDVWENQDRRLTPDIFWNLFSLEPNDLVVALEGRLVCGICQIRQLGMNSYKFDERYDYPHGFGGLVEWIDWDEWKFGHPPTAPGQGIRGIKGLRKEADYVERAWRRYQQTLRLNH